MSQPPASDSDRNARPARPEAAPQNGNASAPNQSGRTGAPLPINVRRLMAAIVLVAGGAELAYVIVNISAMPVFIKDSIGLDKESASLWIGRVATAYLIVEGVMKSPFGLLGDRIGRKRLILVGPGVSIITALLTPTVHNPFALVGLRVIDGLGAAALWPSAFSLIGDHVPEERRSSAMGLFNLAYLLGIALGPVIGGGVNDWTHRYLGWTLAHSKEASFYVAAALFALTFVIAFLFIPNVRESHHHQPHELGPGIEGGFSGRAFVQMLSRLPMTLLMAFVTFLGVGLIMAYIKVFAMEKFGLSESAFGALLIGPALAIAALSVPLGALGDKLGKARAVRGGIGLCMLSFWLVLAFATKGTLVLCGTLIGIGFVVAFPAWMALVSAECDPKQRGAVVGAVGTAQGLGAIFGVAISSVLYGLPKLTLGPIHIPMHGLPFLGCALMLTLSFLLAVLSVHDHVPRQCDAKE